MKRQKEDTGITVKINKDAKEHEVVHCDFINEYRVGDTFYLTAIQLDPEQKLAAVKGELDNLDTLKKVTLVMDKETYKGLHLSHMAIARELEKTGIELNANT